MPGRKKESWDRRFRSRISPSSGRRGGAAGGGVRGRIGDEGGDEGVWSGFVFGEVEGFGEEEVRKEGAEAGE